MRLMRRLFSLQLSLFLLWQFTEIPSASAADDWQYWNEFQLKHSLKKDLDLRLKTELRLRDDFTDLFLTNLEVGLIFKPNKHFEFGPVYKFEHEKSLSGQRTKENRISVEGTFKFWYEDFKLSNRHRISHRDISGKKSWRYRSKLKISRPTKIASVPIKPFISDEIFYDSIPDKLNQNRFSIGFSKQITKNAELEIYYLLKSKRTGKDWAEVNVLGTTFGISF